MAKRFGVIETAIKKYGLNDTIPGTPGHSYREFRAGRSGLKPDQPKRIAAEDRKGVPFGIDQLAEYYRIRRVSVRAVGSEGVAAEGLQAAGVTLAQLGIEVISATDVVYPAPGYIASRCIVSVAPEGAPTTRPLSAVTKKAYTRYTAERYNLPFAKNSTAPGSSEFEAMGFLSAQIRNRRRKVTFKPERLYGSGI